MLMLEERQSIVDYGKRLHKENLSKGTSGNISIFNRDAKLMAISPSGIAYEDTTVEDVVILDIDGNLVEGTRNPSSEWNLHLNVYKMQKSATAIVHAHATFCTTLACLHIPLEAIHYGIASIRTHEVPVVPYETFGSLELANHMEHYLKGYEGKALLLGNHGVICWECGIENAFHVCCVMEELAELTWRCLSVGTGKILAKEEIQHVIQKFKVYGQSESKKIGY